MTSTVSNGGADMVTRMAVSGKKPGRNVYEKAEKAVTGQWPSPLAVSAEQSLSKAIIKSWSLLEACLAHKEFGRALVLLDTLHDITKGNRRLYLGTFQDAFNKYLYAWSQDGSVLLQDVDNFLVTMKARYHDLAADGRSTAILVRAAIDKPPEVDRFDGTKAVDDKRYMQYINMWVKKGGDLAEVLCHIDVLSVVNLKKLVEEAHISVEHVPKEYQPLIEESFIQMKGIDNEAVQKELIKMQEDAEEDDGSSGSGSSSGDSAADDRRWLKELLPALQKVGFDELKSVDSFGLKVIRHSLLALQYKSGRVFLDKYLGSLQHPEEYVDAATQLVNFFKLYRSLRTPQEREVFNELLDEFNEDRQRQLEARAIEGAQESWKHSAERAKKLGGLMTRDKDIDMLLWKWYQDMLPIVKGEVDVCRELLASGDKDKSMSALKRKQFAEVAPFFTLVSPEKMVVITVLELLRLTSTGGILDGMKSARAVLSVGTQIENEHRSESLLQTEQRAFSGISAGEKTQRLRRIIARSKSSFRRANMSSEEITWPQDIKAKIGSLLVSALIKVAKVTVEGTDPRTRRTVRADVPAIIHTYQYSNGTRLGVLKLHKKLLHKLGTDDLQFSIFPQAFPMLNRPKDWKSWNEGGYYFSRNGVVRTKNSPEQNAYIKIASQRGDLKTVYGGLNVLGRTAWTVNERILKILTDIWNKGDSFLAIPKEQAEPDIPPPPPRDSEPTAKRDWQRQARKIANEFGANRSLRCDTNYKLEIARALVGERFYFPHNLDFRGRTYPLSPHFNHLGNDLSRGLLIFWDGKELGPHGLNWLKIHLANLFGHSKMPFDARVRFVDDHMLEIRQSVANPTDEAGFWLTADDPWQALATMFELVDALALPDPSKYISHQPVHQDGTCNGLQHYAALGGDFEGATQVNLNPSDTPQDVYNYVAELTKKLLQNDLQQHNPKAEKLLKVMNRKIVKQTVMTNVYGVTYIGATHQIKKQLDDYFDLEESYELSIYLTVHVFGAIRELFNGAHMIQDWLSECARRITKSVNVLDLDEDDLVNPKNGRPQHMSSVIWTTPLGLPVVQPYREVNKKQVATNLQTVYISDPFEVNQVYSNRQVSAFAPNFVHSLDASHMLMSAMTCGEQNICFASVHDSYWTHASSVDNMNKVLREQFVKLHQENLIARLKTEFEDRYKGNLLIISVPRNHDVAQRIAKFRKDYRAQNGKKLTLRDELVMERTRLKLLSSDQQADRETASKMHTTVSLMSKQEVGLLLDSYNKAKGTKKSSVNIDSAEESSTKNMHIIVPFRCPDIPPRGDFDVNNVTNSKYFFS